MSKKKLSDIKLDIPAEQIKTEIRNIPKAGIIKTSNNLNKEVFDEEALQMPIDAYRIIFKAISDVRNKQFFEETSQLALDFESTFLMSNFWMCTPH